MYVASQRLDQLLELMANDGDTRPMVVTSRDRLDIVMGLLASQVGGRGLLSRQGASEGGLRNLLQHCSAVLR